MIYHRGCRTATFERIVSRRGLERPGIGGYTPVGESQNGDSRILSTAGHVEPRGNPEGPPSKAKYYLVTDSEPVP